MKKLKSLVLNTLLFLHCLLAFMLLFESSVIIPFWIQPLGRMHPLILHFPVAFIALLFVLNLFKKQLDVASFEKINLFLLFLTSLSTTAATIMGLLLSLEETSTDLMALHKWIGVSISFMVYSLVLFYQYKTYFKTVLLFSFTSVIFAGHYGAGLTHGTNFITEPLMANSTPVETENGAIYKVFIQPILDKKCTSCHNDQKLKGNLNLSSLEAISEGGKNGPLWIAHQPEKSNFIKRIQLPLEHKKHMSPKGKPQLTANEIELLKTWIQQGINDTISYNHLKEGDSLKTIISKKWLQKKTTKKIYPFSFADQEIIDELNSPFRSIKQKSPTSPGIDVAIYGRSTFQTNSLTELSKIKEQIVSLNLSKLPIYKEELAFVSGLKNLEKLQLNGTDIKTNDLEVLTACTELNSLSLSNTQVDFSLLSTLEKLPKLRQLYVWNTAMNSDEIALLQKKLPNTTITEGFVQDVKNELILTPPVLLSKGNIISTGDSIHIGHKLAGVDIHYSLDKSNPTKESPLLTKKIVLDLQGKKNKSIKTIAFKEGWKPSKVETFTFFSRGFVPSNLEVSYEGILGEYVGNAATILIDDFVLNKSKIDVSKYWAGFKERPLIAIAEFKDNTSKIKEVSISCGYNSYRIKKLKLKTYPLKEAQLWTSTDKTNWKLESKKNFRNTKPIKTENISFKLKPKNVRYYKIVIQASKGHTFYVNQLFFR
ncbi:c-type cytochrome domain-containing protein [Flavicella sediminum]|uniref:c-type cytochrome domain-containing protein n=1 Tax=Flavicella sediminum TaxID=2585141 RepID=UPI0011210301|nr:FN3 associated domain-containing protein [Flavicella sediminum]